MARYIEDRSAATLFVQGSLESLLPEASVARTLWSGLSRSRKGLRRGVKKLGEVIASKLSEESSGDSLEALRGRKARLERAFEEMTALGKTGDGDRMTITEPEASMPHLGQARGPSRSPLETNHPQPSPPHPVLATHHPPNHPNGIEGKGNMRAEKSDKHRAIKTANTKKCFKKDKRTANHSDAPFLEGSEGGDLEKHQAEPSASRLQSSMQNQ